MGAADFQSTARGKTPKEAFDAAVREAQYENGHGGYTGTIAEKNSFTMLVVPADMSLDQYVSALQYGTQTVDWNPFDDKWGPAGCVKTGEDEYLFFGSASC